MTEQESLSQLGLDNDLMDLATIIANGESYYSKSMNADERNTINEAVKTLLDKFPAEDTLNGLMYLRLIQGDESKLKKILNKIKIIDYKCPVLLLYAEEAGHSLLKRFRICNSKSNVANVQAVEQNGSTTNDRSFFQQYKIPFIFLFCIIFCCFLFIGIYQWANPTISKTDYTTTATDSTTVAITSTEPSNISTTPVTTTTDDITRIEYIHASAEKEGCNSPISDPKIRVRGSGKFYIRQIEFDYESPGGSTSYSYYVRFSNSKISDNRDDILGSTNLFDRLEPGVIAVMLKNGGTRLTVCDFLNELSAYNASLKKITYQIAPVNDPENEKQMVNHY